jgi:hypothetical protein
MLLDATTKARVRYHAFDSLVQWRIGGAVGKQERVKANSDSLPSQ